MGRAEGAAEPSGSKRSASFPTRGLRPTFSCLHTLECFSAELDRRARTALVCLRWTLRPLEPKTTVTSIKCADDLRCEGASPLDPDDEAQTPSLSSFAESFSVPAGLRWFRPTATSASPAATADSSSSRNCCVKTEPPRQEVAKRRSRLVVGGS